MAPLWQAIQAVPGLSERAYSLLRLRYYNGLTEEQIAEQQAGISHQRISQILNAALRKVRQHFGQPEPAPRYAVRNPVTFLELVGASLNATPGDIKIQAAQLLRGAPLPEHTRRALALLYGLDPEFDNPLPPAEVAQILEISKWTIGNYVKKSMPVLKNLLRKAD